MLQQIADLVQKELIWVVDGGIAFDSFNNDIKIRATQVQLLDVYRLNHARALHININGNADQAVNHLIKILNQYQARDATPVVFHLQRDGYEYQLKTSEPWSVMPSAQCLLALEKQLGGGEYYLEYQ